jgi:DNA-binding XRE family transcriptional regulator
MNNLKVFRAMKNITQLKLAKSCDIDQTVIRRLERDELRNTEATVEKKQAIAQFFGVRVEEIFPDVES